MAGIVPCVGFLRSALLVHDINSHPAEAPHMAPLVMDYELFVMVAGVGPEE